MELERTHIVLIVPTAEIEILTRNPQRNIQQVESYLEINIQHVLVCDYLILFSKHG